MHLEIEPRLRDATGDPGQWILWKELNQIIIMWIHFFIVFGTSTLNASWIEWSSLYNCSFAASVLQVPLSSFSSIIVRHPPKGCRFDKKIKSNLFFFSSISPRSLPPFRIECHASLYSSHLIVLSECNLASLGKEITIIVLPLSESKKTLEFKGPSEIGKKKKKKLVLKGLCTALVA